MRIRAGTDDVSSSCSRSRRPLLVLSCAFALLSAIAMCASAAPVASQEGAVQPGTDEDAGVEARGSGDPPGMQMTARPAIVLPPAPPAPRIAPIVDEPTAVRAEKAVAAHDRPVALSKTILGLLGLITLAYLGGHARVVALERKLGIAQVITSGFPFIVLGLLARTPTAGILTDELLAQLNPLLRVGLGYIGFAAGVRFGTRLPKGIPALRTVAAVTTAPFLLVALLSGLVLLLMTGDISTAALRDPVFVRDALILGTAGAVTAQSSLEIFRAVDPHGAVKSVLGFEEAAGIAGMAIIAAYFRPQTGVTWQLPGTAWLLLTLGLGVTLGVMAYAVMKRPQQGPEFVLLSLGLIGFCAGTAGYLRLSPIVVAFLAGAFLVLLPELPRAQLREALSRLERPVYMLSLVVIGALWQISDWRGWVLVPVFTISRLLGKRLGLNIALRVSALQLDSDQRLAITMAPIGRLAIAIVVNAQLLYPGGSISPIVAAVIVGGMMTEIIVQVASRQAMNDGARLRGVQ
jgi:Kef-type K+ transport system membrane component KefB